MNQPKRNRQKQGGQQFGSQQQWGQFAIIVPISALKSLLQGSGTYMVPAQRQFQASMSGGFDQPTGGQQRQRGGSQGSAKGKGKQRNKSNRVTIQGTPKLIRSLTDSAQARGGSIIE